MIRKYLNIKFFFVSFSIVFIFLFPYKLFCQTNKLSKYTINKTLENEILLNSYPIISDIIIPSTMQSNKDYTFEWDIISPVNNIKSKFVILIDDENLLFDSDLIDPASSKSIRLFNQQYFYSLHFKKEIKKTFLNSKILFVKFYTAPQNSQNEDNFTPCIFSSTIKDNYINIDGTIDKQKIEILGLAPPSILMNGEDTLTFSVQVMEEWEKNVKLYLEINGPALTEIPNNFGDGGFINFFKNANAPQLIITVNNSDAKISSFAPTPPTEEEDLYENILFAIGSKFVPLGDVTSYMSLAKLFLQLLADNNKPTTLLISSSGKSSYYIELTKNDNELFNIDIDIVQNGYYYERYASIPLIKNASISNNDKTIFPPINLFQDLPKNHKYYTAALWAKNLGFSSGYKNRTFQPNAQISRSEFLKFILLASGKGKETNQDLWLERYSDDPGKDNPQYEYTENEWMWPYIYKATINNYVDGYPDKTFRPENSISLAEVIKIIVNAFELRGNYFVDELNWPDSYKFFLIIGNQDAKHPVFDDQSNLDDDPSIWKSFPNVWSTLPIGSKLFWNISDSTIPMVVPINNTLINNSSEMLIFRDKSEAFPYISMYKPNWNIKPTRGQVIDMIQFAYNKKKVIKRKSTETKIDAIEVEYELVNPQILKIKNSSNYLYCDFKTNTSSLNVDSMTLKLESDSLQYVAQIISLIPGLSGHFTLKTKIPELENGKYNIILDVYGENTTLLDGLLINKDSNRKNATVLVIDVSSSMKGDGLTGAISASKNYVDLIANNDLLGIVTFSSSASTYLDIIEISDKNRDIVKTKIDDLKIGGGTNISSGIYQAKNLLETIENLSQTLTILLMTDGVGNDSESQVLDATSLLVENFITLHTIGLGSKIEEILLRKIAKLTGGTYFQTPSSEELAYLFGKISDLASERKVILEQTISLSPNSTEEISFIIDDLVEKNLFVKLNAPAGSTFNNISTSFINPNGTIITENDTNDDVTVNRSQNSSYLSWNILNPRKGKWILKITKSDILVKSLQKLENVDSINVTISAESSLDILIGKFDKDSYSLGETLIIPVSISSDTSILGANISVNVLSNHSIIDTIYLYDDGKHEDEKNSDGIYSNSYIINQNGALQFVIKAEGTTNNELFTRQNEFNIEVQDGVLDNDNDEIPDFWEVSNSLSTEIDNYYNDLDNDGLTDYEEYINKTIPYISDTDGDYLTDFEEVVEFQTKPNAIDTDGDRIPDNVELLLNTSPTSFTDDVSYYDFNNDLIIDDNDYNIIELAWNSKSDDNRYSIEYDINKDGVINVQDIMFISTQNRQILDFNTNRTTNNLDIQFNNDDDILLSIAQTSFELHNIILSISISGVKNLGAFQFKLKYDPISLNLKSINNGNILQDENIKALGPTKNSEDNDNVYYYGIYSYAPTAEQTGDGTLSTLNFSTNKKITTKIEITDILLVDTSTTPTELASDKNLELYVNKDNGNNHLCFTGTVSFLTDSIYYRSILILIVMFILLLSITFSKNVWQKIKES